MKLIAKVTWKSPSNIAFIKYWGKKGDQLPQNVSLSLTLDKCYTKTTVKVYSQPAENGKISFNYLFDGKENTAFSKRIGKYLDTISDKITILNKYHFEIESENSFPHSAGIASSASSISALALCLITIEQRLGKNRPKDFYQEASNLARLGSGSASRSIFGEYATWGKIDSIKGTSDEFASSLNFKPNSIFKCLRDTILIIDDKTKKVSSSAGHKLMEGHPYAGPRFINAKENFNILVKSIQSGDFNNFARILELEALSLHALMMTADPWYTLFEQGTLLAIQKIRDFRNETGLKITFTLDAGPNVHVIYPAEKDEKARKFIGAELLPLTKKSMFIPDFIGSGPELLTDEFRV